jgi:hypothetical protein
VIWLRSREKGELMRVFISAAVVVVGLALAAAATAARPFHVNFDDTFTDNICGLDVAGEAIGVDNFSPVFDSAGNLIAFKDTSQVKVTFTRNGKSLVVASAGQHTFTAVGDFSRIVTFTDTFKGLPERIFVPNGPVITRDAGVITFQNVVDFSTNPNGDLISSTVLINKGPHPEADADFALFCQVFTAALG